MLLAPIKHLRQFLRILFLFLIIYPIFAKQLPLKIYTSTDGLANDTVTKIVADSRGFLWFCTSEGLSRFDGYSFKNYTQEDGLPHREIYDLLETKNEDYLIATPKGLVVFNPLGKSYRWNIIEDKLEQNSSEPPLFKTYLPANLSNRLGEKSVYTLAQDGNGNIYAAAKYGLYRFVKTADDWQFQRFTHPQLETDKVEYFGTLFTDSRGDVWLGVDYFVYRILKTGEVQKISENGHTDWKKFRGLNGLLNMQKRATELGGEYETKSKIGEGTVVILSVPLLDGVEMKDK